MDGGGRAELDNARKLGGGGGNYPGYEVGDTATVNSDAVISLDDDISLAGFNVPNNTPDFTSITLGGGNNLFVAGNLNLSGDGANVPGASDMTVTVTGGTKLHSDGRFVFHSTLNPRDNNTFILEGAGTEINTDGLLENHFCKSYNNSFENTMIVRDGATFTFKGSFYAGGDLYYNADLDGDYNRVIVSNAIIRASDPTVGGEFFLGARNMYLYFRGTQPLVDVNAFTFRGYMWFYPTLRFEVPANGYPTGHVPLVVRDDITMPNGGAGFYLRADVTDFVAAGGDGLVPLIARPHGVEIPPTSQRVITPSAGYTWVEDELSMPGYTIHSVKIPTARTVDVTLDTQGGTVSPGLVSVTVGETFDSQLPTPSNPGRVFLGWFNLPVGGTMVETGTLAPNADITLYAQWSVPVVATLEVNLAGATISTNLVEVGPENPYLYLLPTPSYPNSDWSFVGWFDQPTEGVQITSLTLAPTANFTNYAQWCANESTWVVNSGATDPTDWFDALNWDPWTPGFLTRTFIREHGAEVYVSKDTLISNLTVSALSEGAGITLTVAQGATLTVESCGASGAGRGSVGVANEDNSTPIVLDIKGRLAYNRENVAFGRGNGSQITITGGGTISTGYQFFFGNGLYWDQQNFNSRAILDNVTMEHFSNTFYGHCFLTNSVISCMGGSQFEFAIWPGAVATLHGMTITNRVNTVQYGARSILNTAVLITGNSEIHNQGGLTIYASGGGSTVTLEGHSTITDSQAVYFFRDNANPPGLLTGDGRRFIVDDASYASTNETTVITIGGDDDSFTNNWIIVRNNGTFEFANAMSFGTTVDVEEPNGIEIDNSTFTGGSLNLRNNSVLDVKGGAAAVALDALTCSDTTLDNAPTLKVTVPVDGFASAPITVEELDTGMNLAVDALAFTAAGGQGTVPILAVAGEVADLDATTFWRSMTLESRLEIVPRLTPITIGGDAYTLLSVNIRNRATMILVR